MRPLPSLALILALAAPACRSQPSGADSDREDTQRDTELRAMHPPRVSILAAIDTAQRTIPTGRVLGAALEIGEDTPKYWTFVVDGDELHVLRINGWNGVLLTNVIDDGNRALVEFAAGLRGHPERIAIDFGRAIESAAAAVPDSWPSSVFLVREEGDAYAYSVELVTHKEVRNIEVHAADGTLVDDARPTHTISSDDPPVASDSGLTEAPSISLAASIALARKRQPDGFFLHSEFGSDDGHADYLVAFWTRQGMRIVYIDAASGATWAETTSDSELPAEAAARVRRIATTPLPVIEPSLAITTALDAVPGSWARMIDVDGDASPLEYVVEVVTREFEKYARVRATDGKLLSVSSSSGYRDDP